MKRENDIPTESGIIVSNKVSIISLSLFVSDVIYYTVMNQKDNKKTSMSFVLLSNSSYCMEIVTQYFDIYKTYECQQ